MAQKYRQTLLSTVFRFVNQEDFLAFYKKYMKGHWTGLVHIRLAELEMEFRIYYIQQKS